MPRPVPPPHALSQASWAWGGRVVVAVTRPKRLFTKNTGPCEVVRRGIRTDACPVLERYEERLAAGTPVATLRIQAPVNGCRNYNGTKVAKFLVG